MNQTFVPPEKPPVSLARLARYATLLVVAGLIIGFLPRWHAQAALQAENRADSLPTVNVLRPQSANHTLGTPFPAEVQPFISAAIHARASGYLKSWFVDIGDAVTNGQLLAEIDTPELDQQIAQARAELAQAQAALGLAKITADRWTELLKTASVSEQEAAEKASDYALKRANESAARANLNRLIQLKEFDRVTAPFAGTITLRNTDIGQLIAADSGPELFRLAQTDPLRIYVQVPQPLSHAVAVGQSAELTFQEAPGRVYSAVVTRSAGAVDSTSRTLQVELQVPNPHHDILAGSYAQVRFNQAHADQVLTIADTTLIFRAEGLQLAVLNAENKVELRSVKLGRDYGNVVEVLSGLQADDRVINNPPDAIAEGMAVQVNEPTAPTASTK